MRMKWFLGALLLVPVATAFAQASADTAASASSGRYWGPRFGATLLSGAVVDQANGRSIDVAPVILQVGWSWEQRFVIGPTSPMPMTQFVLLIGGAEQGVFLPSLTWLIGVRGLGGGELGFGPSVSLGGVGMAFAAGVTTRAGALNIPFDIAIVVGQPGPRVSFLTGFNMQRERE